jgi:uncharacterized cupredoxin-like copper-binding protein
MQYSRRLILISLTAAVPVALLGGSASAATKVKVSLWDKGPTAMDMPEGMMPMGMAMSGAGMMDAATMGITLDQTEIPAGETTFTVINESQEFYHALVISPVADRSRELPYMHDRMMVDEEAAGRTAVVKELRPHDAGSVTVDLQPGEYILYCNIAGHYAMGMWTVITVTG